MPFQVDDGAGRVRVAVPRLAHAAGVNERTGRERYPVRLREKRRYPLALVGEHARQVSVPEEAEAAPQPAQDVHGLALFQDVFPQVGLAGAPVDASMGAYPSV